MREKIEDSEEDEATFCLAEKTDLNKIHPPVSLSFPDTVGTQLLLCRKLVFEARLRKWCNRLLTNCNSEANIAAEQIR